MANKKNTVKNKSKKEEKTQPQCTPQQLTQAVKDRNYEHAIVILRQLNLNNQKKKTNLNYIIDMYSWAIFAYDKLNNNVRGSIRSRGPIINEVAANFGGGGHIYASGVRLKDFKEVDDIVVALDDVCKKYKDSI